MFNINNGIGGRTEGCLNVVRDTGEYRTPTSFIIQIILSNYLSFITILPGEIDPFSE